MFEGLDNVDWESIKSTNTLGKSPGTIPIHLRKMLSDDKEVRKYYWNLLTFTLTFNELGHLPEPALQLTLPFLFELLESDVFQENAWILFFLFMVLDDSRDHSYNDMVKHFREYLENRITLIRQLTTDSNLATRFSALDILQELLDSEKSFIDYTLKLISAETNFSFKVYTVAYVAMYISRKKFIDTPEGFQTRTLLRQILTEAVSKPHKGAIAYSAVQFLNMRLSPTLVDILRDWQTNPQEYEIESDVAWYEDYEDLVFIPNFRL